MLPVTERVPLLILGLGNLLCEDDGVGAVAVARLQHEFDVPDGVVALDGGTLGLSLLSYFLRARTVILVDAVRADSAPGSIVRLEGDDVAPAVMNRLSVHQVGVADLLDGARLLDAYPEHIVLLGVVPETIGLGFGCSPAIQAAVPGLIDRIVEEARLHGFDLEPRRDDEPAPGVDRGDLASVLRL
jgi:hydrogenase maturation protease